MHLTNKKHPFLQVNKRFIQDSFSFFRVRGSGLKEEVKGLKRREKLEAENF